MVAEMATNLRKDLLILADSNYARRSADAQCLLESLDLWKFIEAEPSEPTPEVKREEPGEKFDTMIDGRQAPGHRTRTSDAQAAVGYNPVNVPSTKQDELSTTDHPVWKRELRKKPCGDDGKIARHR